MVLQGDRIVTRSVDQVRHRWEEAFKAMAEQGDDVLLDGSVLIPTIWDEEEWEW